MATILQPAKRRFIDEDTGDYFLVNGRPKATGIDSSVVLALRTTRGSCIVAPELGDRTNSVRKLGTDAVGQIESFGREALQHLLDRRDIRDLSVTVIIDGSNVCRIFSYTDISGERQTVTIGRRVGT